MVSKKWKLLAASVAAAVALAGCASTPQPTASEGGSKEPYVAYVNLALTGGVSNVSKANLEGLQAATDAINKEGGILGRQVELVVQDDLLDTTKAVSLFTSYLSSHDKPQAVFAGNTSNELLAMQPQTNREKLISMGTAQSTALDDTFAYPYSYINFTNGQLDANAVVSVVRDAGYKKVALVAANDANGQSVASLETAAFGKANIAISVETYTPGDLDMTSQLQRLQATHPDVLIIQGFGAFAGHVLTSRTKLGWDIPTIAHSSLGNGANLGQITTPKDWDNLKVMAMGINAGQVYNKTAQAALVKALKAAGSKIDQPFHAYSTWWDMLFLLKYASEQAGSVDSDKVKAALDNLDAITDSQLVTFPNERFSPEDHFVNFDKPGDAYAVVEPGPLVDGVITPPKK